MNDMEVILDTRYREISELVEELSFAEKDNLKTKPTLATLKASLFLLFYNLVESIIFTSFELLFDEINCNCSVFNKLTAKVQTQYKKYNKNNSIDESDLLRLREPLINCAIGAACNRKHEDFGGFSTIFLSKGIEVHSITSTFLQMGAIIQRQVVETYRLWHKPASSRTQTAPEACCRFWQARDKLFCGIQTDS